MRQRHILLILMIVVMGIGFFWSSVPAIKGAVHLVFNPTIGALLDWNVTWGMVILLFIVNLAMTLVQKYTTDQATLKEIKKEQKEFQKESQQYRDDPAKMMEMNKKQIDFFKRTFIITMRASMFTLVPLVLLFRWFGDYFSLIEGFKFFGYLGWFWFYLLASIVFTTIFRKVFDVA